MEQKQVIIGKKKMMSQIFLETGRVVPVTIITCDTDLENSLNDKSIEIKGKSKGKGFTGVMKKWGFSGGPATRGQSNKPRSGGSIGSQTPGRVRLGKKMAGRHGNRNVTIKGLKIVRVDVDHKELFVSGPVPGSRNSSIKLIVLD